MTEELAQVADRCRTWWRREPSDTVLKMDEAEGSSRAPWWWDVSHELVSEGDLNPHAR